MFNDRPGTRSLIKSADHLDPSVEPDTIIGREDELDQIADGIRPLIAGDTPEHMLVHGPPGIGKSTCVHHVLDKLDEETSVNTVSINCWQYDTCPAFLTQLMIELGYPAPRKGKPSDELLIKLREWLDKNRDTVLVLDEFDQFDDPAKIIYDLDHVSNQADNHLALILVSNTAAVETNLDPRSRSRLNCRGIRFTPYSKHQLKAILEARIREAFPSDAVDDYVPDIIADTVAQDNGDCRQALTQLRHAAQRAGRENADTITPKHIKTPDPVTQENRSVETVGAQNR